MRPSTSELIVRATALYLPLMMAVALVIHRRPDSPRGCRCSGRCCVESVHAAGAEHARPALPLVDVLHAHRRSWPAPRSISGSAGRCCGEPSHPFSVSSAVWSWWASRCRRGSGRDAAGLARGVSPIDVADRRGGVRCGMPRTGTAAGALDGCRRTRSPTGDAAGRCVRRAAPLRSADTDLHAHRRGLDNAVASIPLADPARGLHRDTGRRDGAASRSRVRRLGPWNPGAARSTASVGDHRTVRLCRQSDAARWHVDPRRVGRRRRQPRRRRSSGHGALFSAGLAAWSEDVELSRRFGTEWTRYRSEVRLWVPRWRPCTDGLATVHVGTTCEPCSDVGRFLARRHPHGLVIAAAEDSPVELTRITYRARRCRRRELDSPLWVAASSTSTWRGPLVVGSFGCRRPAHPPTGGRRRRCRPAPPHTTPRSAAAGHNDTRRSRCRNGAHSRVTTPRTRRGIDTRTSRCRNGAHPHVIAPRTTSGADRNRIGSAREPLGGPGPAAVGFGGFHFGETRGTHSAGGEERRAPTLST